MSASPVVRHLSEVGEHAWSGDHRGEVSFRLVFGDGTTPTEDMTSGVAHLPVGGWLALHRHAAPEIYHVLSGRGLVLLDGAEHEVGPGSSVYIPSRCEHGIRNTGEELLDFFFVYAVDAFAEVEHRYSADSPRWGGSGSGR